MSDKISDKRTSLVGYLCTICKKPSAGASMYGVETEEGKPIYACAEHWMEIRKMNRRFTKRQALRAKKKGL